MKRLGLVKVDAHIRDMWRSVTTGSRPTLPQCSNKGMILSGLRSHHVNVK